MKVYIVLVDIDWEKYWEVKGVFRNNESAEKFAYDYKIELEKKESIDHVEIEIEEWKVLN